MPMFYFHVRTVDGLVEEDTIGVPFDNAEQAIQEARDFARCLMREAAEHDETVEHVIDVMDEHGVSLIRLAYRASLQVQRHH